MSNIDQDDRFKELKNVDRNESGDYDMPALVNPLPADRPIGAQPVAVRRKTDKVLSEIKALAAAAGDAWYYRWPVKSGADDSKKWIEGPSIKLANDLARLYGNCDVDVRVVEDATSWVFYARFMDLETGFSMTRPFQQRKNQKSIRGDVDRQRDIAFQIGASKAIRNVVCNSLQTYADYGFEEARNSLIEKIGKNLVGSRGRLLELIAERKIETSRVDRAIGRTIGDMLAPDIAKVLAMLKAIDDGMATIDETFPHLTVDHPLRNETEPFPNDGSGPSGRFYREPPQEARQEPAGEPSAKTTPRRGRPPKQPQEVTTRAPDVVDVTPDEQARFDKLKNEFSSRDSSDQQDQEQREAEGDGIPGFLKREAPAKQDEPPHPEGFLHAAIAHINAYNGPAEGLIDWFRSMRKERAELSMEDQSHLTKHYNAKFNDLSGV